MKNKNRKRNTYQLTIRAILTAIIIVQGMIPFMGYIPLGVVNITIIHITVIIAAITLGPKDGMFIGLVWGLITLIRAWTMPTMPLDSLVFTNPIISVLPRIAVGAVAGYLFITIYKKTGKQNIATVTAATAATITNTVLVLGLMGLLYSGPVASAFETNTDGLFKFLAALAFTNGIPELIAAIIITPLIVNAIFKATSLSPDHK
ncbi:ECF transporter S component [Vagococcus coleopterorum]|uniref:ECF transporter S component n=1 Tax=Vagococcus coleopterorum TaxID=2714946 RepID=A0A6G8ALT3_9ENTE|nr:ECF transporter S component [Vagococcus coleopterorum]QIL45919.1 ECF transporter S component [Vagococcus coleopterorum]